MVPSLLGASNKWYACSGSNKNAQKRRLKGELGGEMERKVVNEDRQGGCKEGRKEGWNDVGTTALLTLLGLVMKKVEARKK